MQFLVKEIKPVGKYKYLVRFPNDYESVIPRIYVKKAKRLVINDVSYIVCEIDNYYAQIHGLFQQHAVQSYLRRCNNVQTLA